MADLDSVKHVPSFAPRPEHIPAEWVIWNAPRPLGGSLLADGTFARWQGVFCHGVFYAAVDPADEWADDLAMFNANDDGYIVDYVTIEEARERIIEAYMTHYGKELGEDYIRTTVAGYDNDTIRQTFWSKFYRG